MGGDKAPECSRGRFIEVVEVHRMERPYEFQRADVLEALDSATDHRQRTRVLTREVSRCNRRRGCRSHGRDFDRIDHGEWLTIAGVVYDDGALNRWQTVPRRIRRVI